MDDEIGHVGVAPVFVSVNDCTVREKCPVRIFEFERDHACRVAAQIALTFGAKFTAHVTGESPLAAAERGLVESHIALSADEGELNRVEDGGFACAVDTNEVGGSLAVDGGVFKKMPVHQTNSG